MKASLTPLYGNLAAVASSMKDWPACVEQCDKVLKKDSNNVKALYRKGVALGRTKDFDAAISCLKKAVQLDATNVASKRALRDVVQAKKTQQKQLKSTYGGMFSKLEGFASSNRPKEPRKLDDYDDLSDLKPGEMEQVQEWELQFSEKYDLVGKLLKPGEESRLIIKIN